MAEYLNLFTRIQVHAPSYAGTPMGAGHSPRTGTPVHVHLLVEKGMHIIECLNLESIAEAGLAEFLFFAAPLRIEGGTGSPIRPVAIELGK